MLSKVAEFLANATVRRLVVSVIGVLFVALNKKFDLHLDADQLYGIVLLTLGYVVQSAAKEAVVAHADAKVEVAETAASLVKPASPADLP